MRCLLADGGRGVQDRCCVRRDAGLHSLPPTSVLLLLSPCFPYKMAEFPPLARWRTASRDESILHFIMLPPKASVGKGSSKLPAIPRLSKAG